MEPCVVVVPLSVSSTNISCIVFEAFSPEITVELMSLSEIADK